MYEGNPVDLQMEKVISADGIFDDTTRACRVYKYDIEDEYIYLELKEDELTAILLDAKYRCYISTKTELLCLRMDFIISTKTAGQRDTYKKPHKRHKRT